MKWCVCILRREEDRDREMLSMCPYGFVRFQKGHLATKVDFAAGP